MSRKKRAHAKDEAGDSGGIAIAVAVVTCPLPNRWAGKRALSSAHPCILTLEEVQMTKGDCVGMLLDGDVGSLTVYKNGVRLGVMVASGLTAEYRWAVSLCFKNQSVRLEAKPLSDAALADAIGAAPMDGELAHVTLIDVPGARRH